MEALTPEALRTLFTEATTPKRFSPRTVERDTIRSAFELSVLGPTASNSLPLRIVIVESSPGKERLIASARPRNIEKTRNAPVTIVMAADMHFYEEIPRLWPHEPENADKFRGPANAARATQFAFMNATLQGAYFMLAARAVGLDVGPMGIEDKAKLDAEFFPDGRFKSMWLVTLGYGEVTGPSKRDPRLGFDEVASFA